MFTTKPFENFTAKPFKNFHIKTIRNFFSESFRKFLQPRNWFITWPDLRWVLRVESAKCI
jgi:hypothetical protein